LFDAPQEREREIVLGGLEDEELSAEGIYAGGMDGAAPEEEPYIEASSAEDLGEDVEPALEDTRVEFFVEEEPKDPAQEDHPTTGKRQKVLPIVLGAAVVLLAVVLFVLARFVANRKAFVPVVDAPVEPPSFEPTSTPFVPVVDAPVEPPSFEPTSTPGTKVRSKDGMEMVYVPEGEFTMGSTYSYADTDERPVREVSLAAYWIDKYEVSNGQYQKCVNAGKCTKPSYTDSSTRSSYYGNAKYDNYPVVYVDWHQAKAYCEWAGGSLPTEAQWEKAARGKNGRKYPWGDESPNSNLVNYGEIKGDTTAVGSYPRGVSPYGAMDMAGNVWEWVLDWYGPYDAAETNNPEGPGTGDYRVLRGGSWHFSNWGIRSAFRRYYSPTSTDYSIGFRCVLPQP
jgi:formylglycine-generating enzyme required for sulfatase activity